MTPQSSGCLLGWLANVLRGEPSRDTSAQSSLPYDRMQYLLSIGERSFYNVLAVCLPEGYTIMAKVRLADLLYVRKDTSRRMHFQNRINGKHIDFVICTADKLQPLLAIELDDASHAQLKRVQRDIFVDDALAAAALPIWRVKARRAYNTRDLAIELARHLPSIG